MLFECVGKVTNNTALQGSQWTDHRTLLEYYDRHHHHHHHDDGDDDGDDDDKVLIGLVEICLEKPTGLLTPPLRPVDFFGLLPANKAKQGSGFKPYLCNLCIAEAGRRKGLGKLLCSICEQV